ncbi:MAG: hypothetical protein M3O06_02845, partial [Pseudomonadota bacterium]|nr:hypothetical protein [Pseudomonadota bacterium]
MLHKSVLLLAPISLAMASPLLAESYEFKTINPYSSVETSARGINNDGDVVGDFADSTQSAAGTELGFKYDDGKYKKISFPGARDTDANGINHEGVIVGTYDTNSGDHGYVLDEGNYIALPDPPNQNGFPDFNAINDEGEIVGVLSPGTNVSGNRGFLFSYGNYTVLDCGNFQTEANGINDQGDIVGECADANFTEHAFLLHDGVYTILDFPGSKG